MKQNCVKIYSAKAKGLLVKEISKVNGIVSQKIEFIDQKHKKWRPNEKLSIKCKHFSGGGGGSYMFISTSEIGHLTLC